MPQGLKEGRQWQESGSDGQIMESDKNITSGWRHQVNRMFVLIGYFSKKHPTLAKSTGMEWVETLPQELATLGAATQAFHHVCGINALLVVFCNTIDVVKGQLFALGDLLNCK